METKQTDKPSFKRKKKVGLFFHKFVTFSFDQGGLPVKVGQKGLMRGQGVAPAHNPTLLAA